MEKKVKRLAASSAPRNSPKPAQSEVETSPREKLARRLREFGSFEKAARYLADHDVELSGSYLSMLAKGTRTPSVKTAKKIARALGLAFTDVTGK